MVWYFFILLASSKKDSLVWVWFSGPRRKCHVIDVRQIYSCPIVFERTYPINRPIWRGKYLLFLIFLKDNVVFGYDTSTLKLICDWGGMDERTLIGGDVSLM